MSYKKGTWKVQCDITGAIVNSSDCRMQWNGLFVLKNQWSPRHPQDTAGISRDRQAPPIPRPEAELTFISATDVTADTL